MSTPKGFPGRWTERRVTSSLHLSIVLLPYYICPLLPNFPRLSAPSPAPAGSLFTPYCAKRRSKTGSPSQAPRSCVIRADAELGGGGAKKPRVVKSEAAYPAGFAARTQRAPGEQGASSLKKEKVETRLQSERCAEELHTRLESRESVRGDSGAGAFTGVRLERGGSVAASHDEQALKASGGCGRGGVAQDSSKGLHAAGAGVVSPKSGEVELRPSASLFPQFSSAVPCASSVELGDRVCGEGEFCGASARGDGAEDAVESSFLAMATEQKKQLFVFLADAGILRRAFRNLLPRRIQHLIQWFFPNFLVFVVFASLLSACLQYRAPIAIDFVLLLLLLLLWAFIGLCISADGARSGAKGSGAAAGCAEGALEKGHRLQPREESATEQPHARLPESRESVGGDNGAGAAEVGEERDGEEKKLLCEERAACAVSECIETVALVVSLPVASCGEEPAGDSEGEEANQAEAGANAAIVEPVHAVVDASVQPEEADPETEALQVASGTSETEEETETEEGLASPSTTPSASASSSTCVSGDVSSPTGSVISEEVAAETEAAVAEDVPCEAAAQEATSEVVQERESEAELGLAQTAVDDGEARQGEDGSAQAISQSDLSSPPVPASEATEAREREEAPQSSAAGDMQEPACEGDRAQGATISFASVLLGQGGVESSLDIEDDVARAPSLSFLPSSRSSCASLFFAESAETACAPVFQAVEAAGIESAAAETKDAGERAAAEGEADAESERLPASLEDNLLGAAEPRMEADVEAAAVAQSAAEGQEAEEKEEPAERETGEAELATVAQGSDEPVETEPSAEGRKNDESVREEAAVSLSEKGEEGEEETCCHGGSVLVSDVAASPALCGLPIGDTLPEEEAASLVWGAEETNAARGGGLSATSDSFLPSLLPYARAAAAPARLSPPLAAPSLCASLAPVPLFSGVVPSSLVVSAADNLQTGESVSAVGGVNPIAMPAPEEGAEEAEGGAERHDPWGCFPAVLESAAESDGEQGFGEFIPSALSLPPFPLPPAPCCPLEALDAAQTQSGVLALEGAGMLEASPKVALGGEKAAAEGDALQQHEEAIFCEEDASSASRFVLPDDEETADECAGVSASQAVPPAALSPPCATPQAAPPRGPSSSAPADSKSEREEPGAAAGSTQTHSAKQRVALQHYMALVRECHRTKDSRGAIRVLERLHAEGRVAPDTQLLNYVLLVCVSANDRAMTDRLFSFMESTGCADLVTYNTLIKSFTTSGQLHLAEQILARMEGCGEPSAIKERRNRIAPDEVTFNLLVNAAVSEGKLDKAWEYIDRIRKANLSPDKFTISSIIKSLQPGQSRQHMLRAFRLMDQIDVCEDLVLLSTCVDACARLSDLERLEVLLSRFEKSGLKPNAHAYGTLIKAYGKLGNITRVWELWREQQCNGVELTNYTLGCMIDCLTSNGLVAEAVQLFESTVEAGSAGAVLFSILIKGLARFRGRGLELALGAYRRLKARRVVDSEHASGEASGGAESRKESARNGDKKAGSGARGAHAREEAGAAASRDRQTAKDGGEKDCYAQVLNTISFNSLLHLCIRSGQVADALELFKDMQSHPHAKPDLITYSTVIKGLCCLPNQHALDAALGVFEQMQREARIAPDAIVYNTLIQGAATRRNVALAESLLRHMLQNNVKPSSYTLCQCVKLYGKCGDLARALELALELPRRFNFEMDGYVYTALIAACTRNRSPFLAATLALQAQRESQDLPAALLMRLANHLGQQREVAEREAMNSNLRDLPLLQAFYGFEAPSRADAASASGAQAPSLYELASGLSHPELRGRAVSEQQAKATVMAVTKELKRLAAVAPAQKGERGRGGSDEDDFEFSAESLGPVKARREKEGLGAGRGAKRPVKRGCNPGVRGVKRKTAHRDATESAQPETFGFAGPRAFLQHGVANKGFASKRGNSQVSRFAHPGKLAEAQLSSAAFDSRGGRCRGPAGGSVRRGAESRECVEGGRRKRRERRPQCEG
ncbi:pentatricopeptide repeat domain-containing protein [Besnoitia besnoiti]|uniref:Pentatricopeptide repeat domain-containing protein n=1 Tax=Besnoitia besnoiti TaxID=94643 RepID=A0A2A9M778_BESBE|nr:pentatricopeptide repeat domain-containing protein [Besnoitia besnoiti]PFH31497.1 pentatricopeptide repeat domain-containing protein [Besnoitia besnoiti]